LRNSIGHQRRARQLDHRADHVLDGHAILAHHLARDFVNYLRLLPQLFTDRHERHHDLELDFLAFTLNLTGSFKDRATLHARHFRKQQSQTATTETEHWIRFTNAIDLAQQLTLVIDLVEHVVHITQRRRPFQLHLQLGQLVTQFFRIRQELMQRRIKETNRYRKTGHLAKDTDEVTALQRQQLFECLFARADALGEDHLAHDGESLIAEEHVLGATQSDSFSA